jgi:hypothetical protein
MIETIAEIATTPKEASWLSTHHPKFKTFNSV